MHSFYLSPSYRLKQALLTKKNWHRGVYEFHKKDLEIRFCKNGGCQRVFKVRPGDPKVFCSTRCAAHINNLGRSMPILIRQKISEAISKLPKKPYKRRKKLVLLTCLGCGEIFKVPPYLSRTRKYCSGHCAIKTIGRRTTSPKASKGKQGIRTDISRSICFYSTWEANIARVFNLLEIKWQYAPKIFDLGDHTYRPDFYLPDFRLFIEVKNFMNEYSSLRDSLFRKRYPDIKLELILKRDYKNIESHYRGLIELWES